MRSEAMSHDRGYRMEQSAVCRWSNPKTILVVTNLLEGPSVILHATNQARLNRAKILLVHVTQPSTSRAEPGCRVAQAALENMLKTFEREGIPCESFMLRGIPTEEIQSLVKSRGVDRVLVGARNARGVERLLMGSVAEELD